MVNEIIHLAHRSVSTHPVRSLYRLTTRSIVRNHRSVKHTCDFCDIVDGRAIATVVRQWPLALAVFPHEPATLGHTLVMPYEHVESVWHLRAALGSALAAYTLDMARTLRTALDITALNIINSTGEVATQTISHLHVHLVPRYPEDGMGEIWPGYPTVTAEDAEEAAARIRSIPNTTGVKNWPRLQ